MFKKNNLYFLFCLISLFKTYSCFPQDSINNIIQTTPNQFNEYYLLANKYLEKESYAKAIGFYKKFTKKHEGTRRNTKKHKGHRL